MSSAVMPHEDLLVQLAILPATEAQEKASAIHWRPGFMAQRPSVRLRLGEALRRAPRHPPTAAATAWRSAQGVPEGDGRRRLGFGDIPRSSHS